MNCSEVDRVLSAYIDDELSPSDSRSVSEHLRVCPSCAHQLAELRHIDRRLASLEPPAGLLDQIVAQCTRQAGEQTTAAVASRGARRLYPWLMIASIAASIAVLFWLQSGGDETEIDHSSIAAQIVRTTGTVHVLGPGSKDWERVVGTEGVDLVAGSHLRTSANGLCEIETSRRGSLRINGETELVVHGPERVEVLDGQLWCRTPASESIQLVVPAESIEIAAAPWLVMCPEASEVQVSVRDGNTTCTSIVSRETVLSSGSFSCPVAQGETVTVDRDRLVRRGTLAAADAKAWQLPLLAAQLDASAELSAVLQPLLAPIGFSKATHLHEQQIRALGPAGALPLLAYVIGEDSRQQPKLRRTAMRLAAESADRSAARLLASLLSDEDGYVARVAGEALQRIEGE